MRNLRTIVATVVSVVTFMTLAATPDWQGQVDEYIAQGEFARAEKVMKSLPKRVRQADAAHTQRLPHDP